MLSTIAISIVLTSAFVSVAYAIGSLALIHENRRYVQSRRRTPIPNPSHFARCCLIVPCKGMEPGLEQNLTQFLLQDHPNFEVIFVVESRQDPCWPLLGKLARRFKRLDVQVVVAGIAEQEGQKVHNLREAIKRLSHQVDVLAFADSDAKPNRSWLRWMTCNVGAEGLGAVSGYRWMVPKDHGFFTLVGCSINNAVASVMGPGRHLLAWGGSWSIHRRVFNAVGIRQAWNGVLSDDLVASRAIRAANLKIRFEPNCICESPVSFNRAQFFEFMRRQFLIARHHLPIHFYLTLLVALITQVAIWGSLSVGLICLSIHNPWAVALIVSSITLYGLGVAKGIVRRKIGTTVCPEWRQNKRAIRLDIFGTPIIGAFLLIAITSALIGRSIRWRGIHYRLSPGGDCRLLARDVDEQVWVEMNSNSSSSPNEFTSGKNVA